VGSSQREATIVAVGLVIVATLVIVYLFNEPHRRDVASADKQTESVDRGVALFNQYCVPCHGPDGKAEGRQGIPLNTEQNQSTDPAVGPDRMKVIENTIHRGRGAIMPAWGQADGGPLNDEQIDDIVNVIRTGAWDKVEELALEQNGGVLPTPPPLPTPVAAGPDQGKALFGQVCTACHISNDYPNGGQVGPNLTGLGAMTHLDQINLDVSEDNLIKWVTNPQSIKPGTIMPPKGGATNWTDADVKSVVEYLLSLK
jgi:sulfur oxidation c-type cytochrome SoxX